MFAEQRASIIVDWRHLRCGNCKIALGSELATHCPACGAVFDSISSNRVGLVQKLRRKRAAQGIFEERSHISFREIGV